MLLPELASVHEQFLALSLLARDRFGDSIGGRLLLRTCLDPDGISAILSASIAGAASLCVDPDADRLREGLRAGVVDFVVGNLDEALRILKNEIRRARAISVGLAADPTSAFEAMTDRGLQPDFLSATAQPHADIFETGGAAALAVPVTPESSTSLLEWFVSDGSGQAVKQLSELADTALDGTRADTQARRRWLVQSPRYLGRSFARRQCLRMTPSEIADFLPRARAAFPSVQIARDHSPA
jgi:hypothetical protein